MFGSRGTSRRRVAALVALTPMFAVLLPPTTAGAAEQAHVTELKAVTAAWGVFLGDAQDLPELAAPIPLTSIEPATALDLGEQLPTKFVTAVTALPDQASVGDLASALAGISDDDDDADPATPDLTVTATPVDGSDEDGIDLTVELAATITSAVVVSDPDALSTGGVSVTVDTPVELVFQAEAKLRAEDVADALSAPPAWIAAGADSPELSVHATIEADLTDAPAAIGVGDISVDGSIDVDATLADVVSDPDGDGRLAFFELASDGVTEIPAELVVSPDQLLDLARSGSASAGLDLASALVALGGPVSLDVPAVDLATDDPEPAVTGDADDLAELAAFQRIIAFDLLNGLNQYAMLLRAAHAHPNVDLDLPLVDGRSSELMDIGKDLAGFVDERVSAVPPGSNSEGTTTTDPEGDIDNIPLELDFDTVGELVTMLEAEDWINGAIPVDYAEDTDRLTLGLHLTKALEADFVDLTLPPPPEGQTASPVGLPRFGGELNDNTGLRGIVPSDDAATRQVRTAYDVTLPLVVDLVEASSDGPAGEDDPDTAVVEFQDPMPFERFRVPVATEGDATAQISATTLLRLPEVAAEGQIGFVPATIVGEDSSYEMGRDGENPTTTALLKTVPGVLEDPTPRLGDLLANLSDGDPGNTTNDAVAVAHRRGRMQATLAVDAHGADPADTFTADPGVITIDRTFDTQTGIVDPPHDASLDATATRLKALDIDTSQPARLLGNVLDTADGVAKAVESISGVLGTDLPLIGTSPGDLVSSLAGLKAAFDAVRTGPTPATLADLETKVEAALDLEADELTWELKNLTGTDADDLIAQFSIVREETDVPLPVRLDVGPAELTATGLEVGAGMTLDLGIAIPVAAGLPAGAPKVVNDGGATVSANVDDGGDFELTAQLGPFETRLGDAGTGIGRLQLGAQVSAAPATPDANAAVDVGDFLSNLTIDAGGPDGGVTCTPADPGGTAPEPPTVTGDIACLSAPLFVEDVLLSGSPADNPAVSDYLQVAIDDDLSPQITAPDFGSLDLKPLSFDSFDDGLASIKALLEAAIVASNFGAELPVVGDDLQAGAELLEKVSAFLDNPFSFIGVPPADATVGPFLYGTVRNELFNVLNPLGILRDSAYKGPSADYAAFDDADNVPSAGDIRIVALCGDDLCAPTDSLVEVTAVTFEVELGQGARDPSGAGCEATGDGATPCPGTKELPLDFGLDGLPIGLDVTLVASAGWTAEIGFGISRAEGFFLLDNPVPGTGVPDVDGTEDASDDELRIGASLSVKQAAGEAPEANGRLGFIEVTAEDQPEGDTNVSHAEILAKVGLGEAGATCTQEPASVTEARNCTSRVGMGDLLTGELLDLFQVPVVNAEVEVDVRLATNLAGQIGKLLPKVTADFALGWEISTDDLDALAAPTVSFGNVQLDARSLFDNAVGELLREIDHITDPVDPVREFLFAPIPVISDLSRLFGGGDVTFVDLAEIFGDVDLSLLKDLNALLDFVEVLTEAADAPISLGDFSLDGAATQGAEKTPDQVSGLFPGGAPPDVESIRDDLTSNLSGATQTGFQNINTDDGDSTEEFTFPFLDDPGCVFSMLVGGDCDIFVWRPQPLSVRFEYEQAFGPFFGVLYVTLGGYAEASMELGVGFSTRGIRLLAEQFIAGDPPTFDAGTVGRVFSQSIFLTDWNAEGTDIPEMTVKAGITAGGKVSILIAEVGVRGGVEASMDLNWHDGGFAGFPGQVDGKLYIDEAIPKIATPLCLFDIGGRVRAFLEVYAEFGICPFCVEESFELASITLLEFSSSCPDGPPDLADISGDTLLLNVGSRASNRGPGWDTQEAEAFTVRQLSGPDGDGKFAFSVSAFGHTQTTIDNGSTPLLAKNVKVIDAGAADDSFLFQGVKVGAQAGDPVTPNPGDDGEDAPFLAPVTIETLGAGNDVAKTGDAVDTVNGGAENDLIDLGLGNDTANGDAGQDTINGSDGVDTLRGGANNDTIDGGLGGDHIFGDDGHDRLQGGSDAYSQPNVVSVADGADDIHGGNGNDTLDGGSGGDTLYGDEDLSGDGDGASAGDPNSETDAGDDRISGWAGVDTVFAGNGADLVVGGFPDPTKGNDTSGDHLHGNGGNDTMFGRGGDDDLFGGSGADTLDGENGDDQVHGQAGNDPVVRGGIDADDLFGGSGNDQLFGDDGNDDITGDGDDATDPSPPGPGPGSDVLDGGAGLDILLGDNGTVDDTTSPGVRTPSFSETVGVEDTLRGGHGADILYGEGGPDHLFGGVSADLLHGNGGNDDGSGDNDADEIWGDADDDTFSGGSGNDLMYGNSGADHMYGQEGDDDIVGGTNGAEVAGAGDVGDFLYGQADDDRVYGDNVTVGGTGDARTVTPLHGQPAGQFGDDLIDGGVLQDEGHGQDGTDNLYGGSEHDQLFGELGGDFLFGQGGPDHLAGDRATMSPAARAVVVPDGGFVAGTPLGSPVLDVTLVTPAAGGVDVIEGGSDDDHAWGGTADDTISGGTEDDYAEGNDGRDRMFGRSEGSTEPDGQDDLIGGSSPVNPLADPDGTNAAPDAGELEMEGNGAEDVMAGDNAIMTRVADGDAWAVDPVTGGHLRDVTLLDTEKGAAALDPVSGPDLMSGNAGDDRMFGEGGNDRMRGNAQQDLVEGNQDSDWLEGNGDEDDLIGGSSAPNQRDTGDILHGGADADVLAGDNACVVRDVDGVEFTPASCDPPSAATDFSYVTDQIGVDVRRGVLLHDLDSFVADESGADQLNGGEGVDVELGQDDDDWLSGGGGDDYQQGNGGSDILLGDRPLTALSAPAMPAGIALPDLDGADDLPGTPSTEPELSGPVQADGQDDQIGGSNFAAHRDTGDWLFGDGAADFQVGDNGELTRTIEGSAYAVYEERYAGNTAPAGAVVERAVERFDVGAPQAAGVWGADHIYGGDGIDPKLSVGVNDGDDSQWGQDGDDFLFGEGANDDQFGELGGDEIWGGDGEDAQVGDRGGILTRFVEANGSDTGDPEIVTYSSNNPPGMRIGGVDNSNTFAHLVPFAAHPLDRRVSLTHDRDGTVLTSNGLTAGGVDQMHGGPGHDSMHGAFGNDLMNGDSHGDYMYGSDGADVMWGGRGNPDPSNVPAIRNDPGAGGQYFDVMFGGHGADATEAGADIMDYQPRPGVDPAIWFTMVDNYETATVGDRQHHHGVDWMYGGRNRDVMQGDVTANGPNDGDKLIDWNGTFNLYTHCNAAYGGWNDVRILAPGMEEFQEKLAHVTGAGDDLQGRATVADVEKTTSSAFRELAFVYDQDPGPAFSTTPGHFEQAICTSD